LFSVAIFIVYKQSLIFLEMAVTPRLFGILLLIGETNEENANNELCTFGVLQAEVDPQDKSSTTIEPLLYKSSLA